MIKVIFLDRDGTINREPTDGIVDTIEKVKILPSVIPALNLLQSKGYHLLFITNQHGISLGRLTDEEFHKINDYIIRQLLKDNITILDTFYCPHLKEENCDCHKPKTGLINQACKKYQIDLINSYIIGDRNTDILLGESIGCHTIYVKTGNQIQENIDPDFIACNLLEAAEYITKAS